MTEETRRKLGLNNPEKYPEYAAEFAVSGEKEIVEEKPKKKKKGKK